MNLKFKNSIVTLMDVGSGRQGCRSPTGFRFLDM